MGLAAQLGLFMPPLDASDEAVFFADVRNCRVRRVSLATGTITTIAGHGEAATGTAQEIGDGLPALQAGLSTHPMRLALDPRGNILVSDAHQNRIRRIDAQTGVMTTAAGGAGEGAWEGDGGPATQAKLNSPHACRADAQGNLYIADRNSHVIRRVDGASGQITTVAGNGQPGYTGDGGAATEASIDMPSSVCVDADGNVYVADNDNNRVRKVDAASGVISTVVGCGEKGPLVDGCDALQVRPCTGRLRSLRSCAAAAAAGWVVSLS